MNKINGEQTSGISSETNESDENEEKEYIEKSVEATKSKVQIIELKEGEHSKVMKSLKLKPNFFIAFQVNDMGIHEKVKQLQEKVISKNPKLHPALINISTLHVTLAVMHLANKVDVETIKSKLDEWAAKNIKTYFHTPCVLNFKGIKTFGNRVAYLDIEQCENHKKLLDFSENLHDALSSTGYFVKPKNFTPHLTFLKLSKDFKLLKKRKHFKEDFESLKDCSEFFGKQEIIDLQLLSMDDPKDECGYYKCFHKINVSSAELNEDQNELALDIPTKNPENSTSFGIGEK